MRYFTIHSNQDVKQWLFPFGDETPKKDKKKIKLKTDSNVEKTYQPNNISKFIKIYTY